jgi:bifunctional oligoribonuclease and PAP phosphatase NrnA
MSGSDQLKSKLARLLRDEDDFLVATHVQPDGDGLGAMLALVHLLRGLGKKARPVIAEALPKQYSFLPGADFVEAPPTSHRGVFVAVDSANRDRLGQLAKLSDEAGISVNIDHHPDNPNFADYNWVEPATTSTSELIYDLWVELGIEPTVEAAVCIYVGMLTDTGRWQYSNTNAKGLRTAARLIDIGVNPNQLFQAIYEQNPVTWLRLLGIGLAKAEFIDDLGLAYTWLDRGDLAASGAEPGDADGIIDVLRSATGVDVAMVLKQLQPGETKVSLRSTRADVGLMAGHFGGGGHKNASGFISKDPLDQVVSAVEKWLRAQRSPDGRH